MKGANIFMLGQRLKSERERVGMTQPDFAAIAGVGKTTVINWEKDASSPTAVQLLAFKEAGVDVVYVITGERADQPPSHQVSDSVRPYGLSADEDALLKAYRRSTPEARAIVLRALDVPVPETPAKPLVRPSAHEFGPSGDSRSRPRFIGEEPGVSDRKRKK